MMELELWIQTAGAFFAILGFSFILDAPRRFLLYTGLSGAVGWLAYLLTQRGEHEVIMAAFISSLAASLFSHAIARRLKAPVTVFLVCGILPAVPGASIYRSVSCLIEGARTLASFYLMETLQVAGAMALAIFIVDSLFRLAQKPGPEGIRKEETDSSVHG